MSAVKVPTPCRIDEYNPVDGYFALIIDADGRLFAKAFELPKARLIASAPDLLEALQLGHSDSAGLPCGDLLAAANALRNYGADALAGRLEKKHAAECAAIARATGEQS